MHVAPSAIARLRVEFRGTVQGVGFRPCIYRLATELGLAGWVANTDHGAVAEIEGPTASLDAFLARVPTSLPPRASIQGIESRLLDPAGFQRFEIAPSLATGAPVAHMLPDIATCDDCLREMNDPDDRRFRYPFINCTNCGPRYSIISALPYDRPLTSMSEFQMCAACRTEYDDPNDRRFHAQPNACAECGPGLELWSPDGTVLASHDPALMGAVDAIRQGQIVAVKGLGGFHLIVDASNLSAVARLRTRKRREEKPLAVMAPTIDAVRVFATLTAAEERALHSPERPIVLVEGRAGINTPIAPNVAPGNPYLGVMLPYTPLHHLLLAELQRTVVATSANLSDEPICIDEREALARLRGIADVFLVHNRPILRHVDDSIVRCIVGQLQVLRRARGFAPAPISLGSTSSPAADRTESVLGVGPHMKNTVALRIGSDVFLSQHIGDLDTDAARRTHHRVCADLPALYAVSPRYIGVDLHPDYASTSEAMAIARSQSPEPTLIPVQHHYAHVLSCMADNGLDGSALGVVWDGTGLGTDGTIWGGEFLLPTNRGFVRVAHLLPWRLPGGDHAATEPRRAALGLLHHLHTGELPAALHTTSEFGWTEQDIAVLWRMMDRGVNAPWTSSMGRMFDAIAALCGVRMVNRYEGQAAMELEWRGARSSTPRRYRLELRTDRTPLLIDWAGTVDRIYSDYRDGVDLSDIALGWHHALADLVVDVAQWTGEKKIVLTGGCFQNRLLTTATMVRLAAVGLQGYIHQRIPPNDGGVSLGQVAAATAVVTRTPNPA